LLLDGLLEAVARLLPRRAALGRMAAEEAEARQGRAVEQSREAFRRAYEEHFRAAVAAHAETARRTARAVEAALESARARQLALEAGRQASVPAEEARLAELRELGARLRRIEAEGPASTAPVGPA
jgi:hypothetical protein